MGIQNPIVHHTQLCLGDVRLHFAGKLMRVANNQTGVVADKRKTKSISIIKFAAGAFGNKFPDMPQMWDARRLCQQTAHRGGAGVCVDEVETTALHPAAKFQECNTVHGKADQGGNIKIFASHPVLMAGNVQFDVVLPKDICKRAFRRHHHDGLIRISVQSQ